MKVIARWLDTDAPNHILNLSLQAITCAELMYLGHILIK